MSTPHPISRQDQCAPALLPGTAGFTLLEMLVVLALIGLLAGVALPNLGRMLEAYSASIRWAELTAEIDELPFRAYSQSRTMQFNEATASQLLAKLPAGWKVKMNAAIRYRDNGWCDGGRILIITDSGEQRQFELAAPQCRTAGR